MAHTRRAIGETGKLSCYPYIVHDGREMVRPAGNQQRPIYWVAFTRVRISEQP